MIKKILIIVGFLSITNHSYSMQPQSLKNQSLIKLVNHALIANDPSVIEKLPEDLKLVASYLFKGGNDIDLALLLALQNENKKGLSVTYSPLMSKKYTIQLFQSLGANSKLIQELDAELQLLNKFTVLKNAVEKNQKEKVELITKLNSHLSGKEKISRKQLTNLLIEALSVPEKKYYKMHICGPGCYSISGGYCVYELPLVHPDIIKELLQAGADATVKTYNWESLILVPMKFSGNSYNTTDLVAIIKLLHQAGADINGVDAFGKTVLDVAYSLWSGQEYLVNELKKLGALHSKDIAKKPMQPEQYYRY